MDKVAREKTRVKIRAIFRLNILPNTYIILGVTLLLSIIFNFSPSILNDISDTLSIPEIYIEILIRVPLFLIATLLIKIFISFYQIIKLVLFGEKIIPFNDLNLKESLFKYKGKEYSGEAFIEKNNIITDEFIFEKGRKISHIKIRDEFGNIEFEEQWYYESINPHPKGIYEPLGEDGAAYEVSSKRRIVNKYKTWHKNRQLAQRYITYKNGKELEIRFDENGNEIS